MSRRNRTGAGRPSATCSAIIRAKRSWSWRITAGGTASFYAYTIYLQKFLVNTSGFDRATASQIMTVALAIMLLIQPLAGRLSDRVGAQAADDLLRRRAGRCSPIRSSRRSRIRTSVAAAFALVMAALVMVTGYTSINAIVKAELFPADIRALGVALPYAIANTIFGGTAEYIALWLKNIGHERWFYIYISLLCRDLPDRLSEDARDQDHQPDRGGLMDMARLKPAERLVGAAWR